MSSSKAIIVAAGRGRRLGDNTQDIPKCMVSVGGKPILHWQLDAFASASIDDVIIVRGYLGDRIDAGGRHVRFVDNPEWQSNNILTSLMYAEQELSDGFYFSYCDIVYPPSVVASLAAAAGQGASLVIDRRWKDTYEGRTLHPVSEAELALVASDSASRLPRVLQVGKGAVPAGDAAGEFIGLAHFSAEGAKALVDVWHAARAGGLDAPFGRAKALRQAYLTDALNAMAKRCTLAPVFIEGHWREIDTPQDLAAAEMAIPSW